MLENHKFHYRSQVSEFIEFLKKSPSQQDLEEATLTVIAKLQEHTLDPKDKPKITVSELKQCLDAHATQFVEYIIAEYQNKRIKISENTLNKFIEYLKKSEHQDLYKNLSNQYLISQPQNKKDRSQSKKNTHRKVTKSIIFPEGKYTGFNIEELDSACDRLMNSLSEVEKKDGLKPPLPPITALCFQGGGAKGAGYVGGLKVLQENGTLDGVKAISGASAGAITAFYIALGITYDQAKYIFNTTNFSDFEDWNKVDLGFLEKIGAKSISGVLKGGLWAKGISIDPHVRRDIKKHFSQGASINPYSHMIGIRELIKNRVMLKGLNIDPHLLEEGSELLVRVLAAENQAACKGQSFYDWAGMLLEFVVGDANITFGEFAKVCKKNPSLKQMIFKGVKFDTESIFDRAEYTFSADETPNVLVRDALRASMGFPGAFPFFEVKEKISKKEILSIANEWVGLSKEKREKQIKADFPQLNKKTIKKINYLAEMSIELKKMEGNENIEEINKNKFDKTIKEICSLIPKLRKIGYFADGGFLNNYPMSVFARGTFKDPHYKTILATNERFDSSLKFQAPPNVLGFSLITDPLNLNDSVTPLTPRLKKIQNSAKLEKKEEKGLMESKDEPPGFKKLMMGIFKNKYGQALNEDMEFKYKIYNNQTVQVYAEGVSTLEFDAPYYKLSQEIEGAKKSTELWFKEKRDPTKTYSKGYRFLTKKEKKLKKSDPKTFYLNVLHRCMLELIKCKEQDSGHQINLTNARARFYLYQYNTFKQRLYKKFPKSAKEINRKALKLAVSDYEKECVNKFIAEQSAQENWTLIKDDQFVNYFKNVVREHPKKALNLAKGRLTNFLEIITNDTSEPNVMSVIFENTSSGILKEYLDFIEYSIDLRNLQEEKAKAKNIPFLKKTGYSIEQIINDFSSPSMYASILKSQKLSDVQKVKCIHQLKKFGADPLKADKHGKTALHYAIDTQNFELFRFFILECKKNRVDPRYIRFGEHGLPLGHYIIDNTNDSEFLQKIDKDPTLNTKEVINPFVLNNQGLGLIEFAAKKSVEANKKEVGYLAENQYNLLANIFGVTKTNKQIYQQSIGTIRKIQVEQSEVSNAFRLIKSLEEPSIVVENLSSNQCQDLLNIQGSSISRSFMVDLCSNPKQHKLLKALLNSASRGNEEKFKMILDQRYSGKSLLYIACEANNTQAAKILKSYSFNQNAISQAGPPQLPSCLMKAAKIGAYEVMFELLNANEWKKIPKDFLKAQDVERRNVMHLLAQVPPSSTIPGTHNFNKARLLSMDLFILILTYNKNSVINNNLLNNTDLKGKNVFRNLIDNERMDIFEALASSKSLNMHLDELFDLYTIRKDGLSDIEYALQVNPKLSFKLINLSKGNRQSFIKDQEKVVKVLRSFEENLKEFNEELKVGGDFEVKVQKKSHKSFMYNQDAQERVIGYSSNLNSNKNSVLIMISNGTYRTPGNEFLSPEKEAQLFVKVAISHFMNQNWIDFGVGKKVNPAINQLDSRGGSVFRNLVKNNKSLIIKELVRKTKGNSWFSRLTLEQIFDLNTKRSDGLNDLQFLVFHGTESLLKEVCGNLQVDTKRDMVAYLLSKKQFSKAHVVVDSLPKDSKLKSYLHSLTTELSLKEAKSTSFRVSKRKQMK